MKRQLLSNKRRVDADSPDAEGSKERLPENGPSWLFFVEITERLQCASPKNLEVLDCELRRIDARSGGAFNITKEHVRSRVELKTAAK
jgi:hypothetical protein